MRLNIPRLISDLSNIESSQYDRYCIYCGDDVSLSNWFCSKCDIQYHSIDNNLSIPEQFIKEYSKESNKDSNELSNDYQITKNKEIKT